MPPARVVGLHEEREVLHGHHHHERPEISREDASRFSWVAGTPCAPPTHSLIA